MTKNELLAFIRQDLQRYHNPDEHINAFCSAEFRKESYLIDLDDPSTFVGDYEINIHLKIRGSAYRYTDVTTREEYDRIVSSHFRGNNFISIDISDFQSIASASLLSAANVTKEPSIDREVQKRANYEWHKTSVIIPSLRFPDNYDVEVSLNYKPIGEEFQNRSNGFSLLVSIYKNNEIYKMESFLSSDEAKSYIVSVRDSIEEHEEANTSNINMFDDIF